MSRLRMPRHAIVAAVMFIAMQAVSAPAQAAPITYTYLGEYFNACGYGCDTYAPANWASDRVIASVTFADALPNNMAFQDVFSSPNLLSWSIGDALGMFTLSSATGGTLSIPSELFPSPLMLSTDASGNIANWVMGYSLGDADPTVRTEIGTLNPPVLCPASECGVDTYINDFFTPNLQGPTEWDAFVATTSPDGLPGQWTAQPVPEPASLTLMLLGGGVLARRRRPSRRA